MATQRMVSDPSEYIKAKDLKRLPGDYPPLIERKRLIKWEANFREFVLRQLPTFNLATIEWVLDRKPTEVVDIKHDLILARIHGWLVMASMNDEFTKSLLEDNLEVKGVIDKLFKETFTEMIMHSYYTSGLNFVTDVKRMLTHCTEKRSMTISEEL